MFDFIRFHSFENKKSKISKQKRNYINQENKIFYSYYSNQINDIIWISIDHLMLQEMQTQIKILPLFWIHDSIWN